MKFKQSNNIFQVQLTLEEVLKQLDWETWTIVTLINHQWYDACQTDHIKMEMIKNTEKRISFFPNGLYKKLEQEKGIKEAISHFQARSLCIVQEFYSLKKLVLSHEGELKNDLESYCDIYGSFGYLDPHSHTCLDPKSVVNPRYCTIPMEWKLDLDKFSNPWLLLKLDCSTVSSSIAAFSALPENGFLYFFVDDWRDNCFVRWAESDKGEQYIPFRVNSDEFAMKQNFNYSLVGDHLYVSNDIIWDHSSKQFSNEFEEWEKNRDPKFRSGHYPPEDFIRIGGKQAFDGQGNLVIGDEERIIVQTSHKFGYGSWGSWAFFSSLKDLEAKEYSNTNFGMVDDA